MRTYITQTYGISRDIRLIPYVFMAARVFLNDYNA